jgi:hypothetical protein
LRCAGEAPSCAVAATDPASGCAVASSSLRHTRRGKCSRWAGVWTLSRQKDTRRGALHPAIQTIGKELAKYRPHRPREINRGKIPAKHHIRTVNKRSVFVRTGDNLPSAVDSRIDYRPQESPANNHIIDDAVVAGGILLDLVTGDHSTSRPRSADFDHVSPEPPRTPFKPRRRASTTRGG